MRDSQHVLARGQGLQALGEVWPGGGEMGPVDPTRPQMQSPPLHNAVSCAKGSDFLSVVLWCGGGRGRKCVLQISLSGEERGSQGHLISGPIPLSAEHV